MYQFLDIGIVYPPVVEKIEVVRQVERFSPLADQIEKQVIFAQTRVNNLTQSILAKVFRGEPTAEWREQNSDMISGENSAETLLKKSKKPLRNLYQAVFTTTKQNEYKNGGFYKIYF